MTVLPSPEASMHSFRSIRLLFEGARRRLAGMLLLAAAALAGAGHQPPVAAQTQAQPMLPIATLQSGIHLIRAEVASSPQQRASGLMFRKSMEPNHGMLFVFPEKAGHCFWMRNTSIPLSIAFLDDDGTIVNIADMQPHSEASHCPLRAVRYALEMEQGWFARRGVEPGSRLRSKQFFGD